METVANASTLSDIVANKETRVNKKRAAPAEYCVGRWVNGLEGGSTKFVVDHGPFRTKVELNKVIETLPEGDYEILHGTTKSLKVKLTRKLIVG